MSSDTVRSVPGINAASKAEALKNTQPLEVISVCPVCAGKMDCVYQASKVRICVCLDCMTSLSVPVEAWDVARQKRAATESSS